MSQRRPAAKPRRPITEDSLVPSTLGLSLKTLVVSDLVSSTRLVTQLGDRKAADLFQRHDRTARDLLRRHHGREIDKTDGFLLLFKRPIDAVLYALAYHQALADLARDQDVRLASRIGIHLGEVLVRENAPEDVRRGAKPLEVEGLAKVTAARVMSAAMGAQTLLTAGAFNIARRAAMGQESLDDNLSWLAHGDYFLQGMDEPVAIFEVGRPALAPLRPPPDSEKVHRADQQGVIPGWRPAAGQGLPTRPHWRIGEKLGEGGFGEVWLVRHIKTGERRAFKFCFDASRLRSLKREITLFRLLTEELGARPDIAHIFDWNFDEAPYFIESEYTAGGNLQEWIEEQGGAAQVPLTTRLEIVAQVATALAAAHSVGVLHKDVKPSNVLIATGADGTVQAQLTDFGLGLLTRSERLAAAGITVMGLTESAATSRSSISGTRLYTAPELLEGKPATLQADIYALGVMLYQLVVGGFRHALAPGWRRHVEDEILVEDIACFVDGSPDRRPASALEVAERLRHLEERRMEREAAEAARLALGKAQRRRKLWAAIAAVAVGVSTVVSVFAVGAVQAHREEAEARQAAEQVSRFLIDLFEVADPDRGPGDAVDVRELLDRSVEKLRHELQDQPLVRARLLFTIGEVYSNLGLFEPAEGLLTEALEVRRASLPEDHQDVVASLNQLGVLYRLQQRYSEAESLLRQVVELRKKTQGPDSIAVALALNNLGNVFWAESRLEEAEAAHRRALEIRERELEPDDLGIAESANNLGVLLISKKRWSESLSFLNRAAEIFESKLGPEHPRFAAALNNLSLVEKELGQIEEAEEHARQALSLWLKDYGPDHPRIVMARSSLAIVLEKSQRWEEAEPLRREVLEIQKRRLGPSHQDVGVALNRVAITVGAQGDLESAEDLHRQAIEIVEKAVGRTHRTTATVLAGLAMALERSQRWQEAVQLRREVVEIREEVLGATHPSTVSAREDLDRALSKVELDAAAQRK